MSELFLNADKVGTVVVHPQLRKKKL